MYTLAHDQRTQTTLWHVSKLRGSRREGPAQCDVLPTIRHGNPASGAGRAPRVEPFRRGGSGHPGTFKKATLRPCAVHTACYFESMSNATKRFDVTTASGTVLCGGIESLSGAYAYAEKCSASGWAGLLIKCTWTGIVVSRA